jgi:pimeloyl-ACP methyl ester carboxylesterase
MATFCLIHGSGQNATAWQLLDRELTARGHEVFAPSIPTSIRDAGAAFYAEALANSVPARTDVVLVAHSASGLILPVAAEVMTATLMVFLAAAIPVPGKSFMDQLRPDPTDMLNPEWSQWAARERLGVQAIELPGGHCPHISRPDELAAVLLSLTE